MADEPSFWKLPAQIVVGLIAFVGVVLVALILLAAYRHRDDPAKQDRATMQSLCTSVINNIENLPGGISPSTRAGIAAALDKEVAIARSIAGDHSEYDTLTEALSGVHDRFAAGQPPGLDALIRECVAIGAPVS